MVLAGTCNPWFFRTGIILFRKRFPCSPSAPELDLARVDANFRSWLAPSFLFRRIGPREYAFREKFIQFTLFSYTPLMHGHIRIDEQEGTVTVAGRAYWCILAFGLFIFGFGFMGRNEFLLVLFLYVGLYAIQAYRFNRVGGFVSGMLSEPPDDEVIHRNNMTLGRKMG